MPQHLLARQKELWQFLPNLSDEDNIKILIGKMAICRQAVPDKQSLELYTETIRHLDLRAFQVAMATLAESPREDGQTALPSLGDILAAMDDAREFWPDFAAGRTKIDTTPLVAPPEQRRLKA